ncbi:aldo/keto reductase [Ktedonosporobacter rubrisoli]|uniref:Aldo/keto reductase n=1 Tax=Ktedonosporobacter rubrisoli TaxID=2509675 RepID=A0A4P6JNH9_KTERU|nr:aldo/keto reductase [Ktedonosporobacter rubrisoli]QBD76286.1 aldo/keto reductase [Ktedonosporobacter rubrisoli]
MIQVGQRQLGASGIMVPSLGIGIWSWGDRQYWDYGQNYTREDISQAYKVCLDAGLNFFDTAEIYGSGMSERLLGDCMRADGRPIVIASKFAPLLLRFSARSLLTALDHSLERLGVERIDLYQIHWPSWRIGIQPLMDTLAEAVRSGKVRAVGVSNYSAVQMRMAYERLKRYEIPLASNQVHYSLLNRKPESNGVLAACRELNVALIAYSPLEQGLLTGKYRVTLANEQPITGSRRFIPAFSTAQRQKMEPLMETLTQIARVHDKTCGQVALNWLLEKDEHIIPIPGARNMRQAQENTGALGWRITPEEQKRLDTASELWL